MGYFEPEIVIYAYDSKFESLGTAGGVVAGDSKGELCV
jgi:hypothetical protein